MKSRWSWLSVLGASLGATLVLAAPASADTGPAHQSLQSRPTQLGTSGGNINDRKAVFCCAGTLGGLVSKGGVQYILSNNHVLARTNEGSAGDDIIQPGLIDQNPSCAQDASDIVADLSVWVPIVFTKDTPNAVDAAIAQVRPGMVSPGGSILDIGMISSTPAVATIDMGVKKSGRTTGLTAVIVAAVNVTIDVKYGSTCGGGRGTARFTNQIRVTPGSFSAGGDSGSLIVEDVPSNPRSVGLLRRGLERHLRQPDPERPGRLRGDDGRHECDRWDDVLGAARVVLAVRVDGRRRAAWPAPDRPRFPGGRGASESAARTGDHAD